MTNRELAKKIAAYIMTPSTGKKAEHLRLFSSTNLISGVYMAGWTEVPLAESIQSILDDAQEEKKS